MDTEYSELDVKVAKLLSIIIGVDNDTAYEISPELIQYLTPLKSSELIYFQNFVVDHYMLNKHGLDLSQTPLFDTMLAHHLIDEREEHGLDAMVKKYYNDNYKEVFWSRYKSFDEASHEEALAYSCKDGIYTYRLGDRFRRELKGKEALLEQSQQLSQALFETEILGVRVNTELIKTTYNDMSLKISEYLPKLRGEFEEHCQIWEFNKYLEKLRSLKTESGKLKARKPTFSFSSDKQVTWLVYDSLAIPVESKTKKGNPSTSYDTLNGLKTRYPVLGTLVKYKEDKSIFSTFVEGMLDRVVDDRIYPHFNVNGTATGRPSHSNPNLGNLPTDGVIRNFFIPDKGMFIIGADYSQIEVVVEANLTEDKQLLRILNEGMSKHDITAEGLKINRDSAKTLNFALQYGAGAGKVAKILGTSRQDAEDIFKRYWELYSGVRALKEETIKELKATGKVTNIFGRTRHFNKPQNKFEGFKQERQAYNFKIQGPAGDICNRAYIGFNHHLKKTKSGRTLWSVHDEILGEVKQNRAEEEKQHLVRIMEDVTNYVQFKYKLQAKAYGPLSMWSKT